MGDLRAAPVVGPGGRGGAPTGRPNDLNSTTKITHSIFFHPSVSTFTSAAGRKIDIVIDPVVNCFQILYIRSLNTIRPQAATKDNKINECQGLIS